MAIKGNNICINNYFKYNWSKCSQRDRMAENNNNNNNKDRDLHICCL